MSANPMSFSGWPSGMDNVHADHELDAKTLRRAVNADVLDSGKIRRRKGFSPLLSGSGYEPKMSAG